MKLLLDTHALLWSLSDPDRIGPEAAAMIVDRHNEVVVSAVSALEIAIKQFLGKLTLPGPAETWLPEAAAATGLDWIPITPAEALRVRALPSHHRDPFDRLLVAQALTGYSLVTHDRSIEPYGIPIVWI